MKSTVRLYSLNSGQLRPYTTWEIDVLQNLAPASPLLCVLLSSVPSGRMLVASLCWSFRLATVKLPKSWYMMMTRKVRAYQEQKSHTAVMRISRRRIAKLAVKRKGMALNLRDAWRSAPSSSRAALIHTSTRCGPRGDSVSKILSSGTEGLVSNVLNVYRELLLKLLADFLMYYCTKPTPKIETRYQSAKTHSAQLFTVHPVS